MPNLKSTTYPGKQIYLSDTIKPQIGKSTLPFNWRFTKKIYEIC